MLRTAAPLIGALGINRAMVVRLPVREVILEFPTGVRAQFVDQFQGGIEEFTLHLEHASADWQAFRAIIGNDLDKQLMSGFIYLAINSLAVSMHLFLSGFSIAAGNCQRQVIESIAMALLGSKPHLGYLRRFHEGRFTSNKALETVLKKHKLLNVNKDALVSLRTLRDHYHNFSHPTEMTAAMQMSMGVPYELYFGAAYDETKILQYRKELTVRINLAKLLINLIGFVSKTCG